MKENLLPSDIQRKRIVKIKDKTNPDFGMNPNDRSIEELIDNGLIIIDKPDGPTSHQVDSWIKNIIGTDKIGHGGTLDPNATGVLPIGVNRATRVLPALLSAGKEYIGVMKLHSDVDEQTIIETCKDFVGRITQLPPVRSAVKRVRRKRTIFYLDVLEVDNRNVLFKVGCESGTYVRTLCVDIGKRLKTRAHLSELRRTRVGHLIEEDCVILQDLKDAFVFWKEDKDESNIREIVHPVEYMLRHLPKIIIRDSAVDAICNGAPLAFPGIIEFDEGIKKKDEVAILTLKGEGVAVAKSNFSSEEFLEHDSGICAVLQNVIMKKGTYPSFWKKS